MLSTFFFGGTTKPLVFSFSASAPNRSPFAVFGFFLFFLFSVLLFLFIYSIFVWAFLGCLEDLGSRSKLICNDTLSAAVPRGFPALEPTAYFLGGCFQPFPTQLSLGLLVYLVDEFVRIIAGFAFPHSRHVYNPMPRNFDLRFVVFFLGGGSLVFKYIDLRTRDRVERQDWQHCSLVLQTCKFAA